MRDCKHCGVKITERRFNAIYCSDSCQKAEQAKRFKKPPCIICGGVLDRKSSKYCSSKCYGVGLSKDIRENDWSYCKVCGKENPRKEYTCCSDECLKLHRDREYLNAHPEIMIDDLSLDLRYYLMGLIWTDGCLVESGKRSYVFLGLKDGEHIEKIAKILNIEKTYHNKQYGKFDFYSLHVKHPSNIEYLKSYGLVKAKSLILKMPFDPETEDLKNVASFLRGVFDGDGSISISKCGRYRRICICSGSKEFIEGLQVCLARLDINANIRQEQRKNILYYIGFSSKEKIKKFYAQCYSIDCLSLDRKRDKFMIE